MATGPCLRWVAAGKRWLPDMIIPSRCFRYAVTASCSQDYRKVVELSDNMLVAASGDQGDVEMFVEWLKVRKSVRLA